ncbi:MULTISPECIES: superoxide dismutase family protein [Saccharibacillus]|uniref:Superoxide dismutase n=1 Tax=Saccharibacillus brassicae TaxID=2583377 RepID=A0A4Y6V128_SACBS|nr:MULTISPECIES: superoxide dismutase family protein [Saccharibacillus]MWJ32905.1 superoxide dismutase [Saccharibacillus sp. WB 17]QDH22167.1 superoxide dismutase [Saccharibacillus brassicae]
MAKKPLGKKHLAASFVCGAVLFSGLTAGAAGTSVSAVVSNVSFFAFGERQQAPAPTGLSGSKSPAALNYDGTTYVPVRAVGDMLDVPVYWDAANQAISTGSAKTIVKNADGKVHGSVDLTEEKGGVRVKVSLTGLPPGAHGIHVHQMPVKNNDFATALGHFNPTSHEHGHHNPKGAHVGDFEKNLTVAANGKAVQEFFLEGANLRPDSAMSVAGRSIIIHAGPDDQKTDPSGDSGDRIAGGNVPK